MALQFPRSTRVGRGVLASRFLLGVSYEDRADNTKPAFRAGTTRVSFGLGGDQTAMSGAVPALGGDGAGGR